MDKTEIKVIGTCKACGAKTEWLDVITGEHMTDCKSCGRWCRHSFKAVEPDGEIVKILEAEGYVTVVGAEQVQQMIRNVADGSAEKRCSGWRIFPDGTHCPGCGDCDESEVQP